MSRRGVLVLAAVLLAQTVIVALAYTPQPHSGGDNAGYIALAHSLLDRGTYQEIWDPAEPPHTKYPPVFSALLALAILLGAKTWAALKLVPAFSTILAVVFAYLWARERKGLAFGVGVALLMGLSESVVYYSQWILSDPTFLALTMAALFFLQRSLPAAGGEGGEENAPRWLAGGLFLVVVAYFTRAAGLPLVVAAALWLGLGKRWRPLAAFAGGFGVPALLWWLRGVLRGSSEYVSEFWLKNPYQPEAGTIGLTGLPARAWENLVEYVTYIVPEGVVGEVPPFLPMVGLGLAALTLVGWVRAAREQMGTAEIFFPLYFGLILLWPPTWSGDRFSLPLLPLVFFYSGCALAWLLGPIPARARQVVVAGLLLAVIVPAAGGWVRAVQAAEGCRDLTREGRNWECLSVAHEEYSFLAEWTGDNLPDGAVVSTRKPRFFFVMSGVKSRALPLTTDPDLMLDRIREGGGRYASLDFLDRVASYYLLPAVLERPWAFCGMVEIGPDGEVGTQLLGLLELDPQAPEPAGPVDALMRCPDEMYLSPPRGRGYVEGWEIPLLMWDGD